MTRIALNIGTASPRRVADVLLAIERLGWVVGCSLFFFLVYGSTNWIASTRVELPTVHFVWEQHVPFVPAMIVPYVSIDLLFIASFFLCRDAHALHRHARRILSVIGVAGICFLLFPLQMAAPRPAVDGLFGPAFRLLHGLDCPHNLVPSLHCALAVVLMAAYARVVDGRWRWLLRGWFALIGASTLLTYQHHAIDVVTGVALGVVALWTFPDPFTPAPRARRWDLASRFAVGAAGLSGAAVMLAPAGWVLFWPAASCAILALAYGGCGAAVFRKHAGRLPVATRILLAPYLLAARLVQGLHSRRAPACVRVAPGVVIGRRCKSFGNQRVTAVLDLTAEYGESPALLDLPYHNVPILDLTPPTVQQLDESVRFIRAHVGTGTVYVHCALGLSRSACVAAAWLLETEVARDAEDAIERVRTKRPQVVIDEPSRAVLRAFARKQRLTARSFPARPRTAAALAGS